ncbi:MAG: hypothetical protein WBA77_17485 [Microcoleaceae cyanobacterium]
MLQKFKRIIGIVFVILTLFTLSVTPSAQADPSLPEPNNNGDYIEQTSHTSWTVVDRDPSGLNCRMGTQPIDEIWSPEYAGFPPINSWPVVTTLAANETFEAKISDAGFATTLDQDFKPWIYIADRLNNEAANCFVRANQAFVQPIPEP